MLLDADILTTDDCDEIFLHLKQVVTDVVDNPSCRVSTPELNSFFQTLKTQRKCIAERSGAAVVLNGCRRVLLTIAFHCTPPTLKLAAISDRNELIDRVLFLFDVRLKLVQFLSGFSEAQLRTLSTWIHPEPSAPGSPIAHAYAVLLWDYLLLARLRFCERISDLDTFNRAAFTDGFSDGLRSVFTSMKDVSMWTVLDEAFISIHNSPSISLAPATSSAHIDLSPAIGHMRFSDADLCLPFCYWVLFEMIALLKPPLSDGDYLHAFVSRLFEKSVKLTGSSGSPVSLRFQLVYLVRLLNCAPINASVSFQLLSDVWDFVCRQIHLSTRPVPPGNRRDIRRFASVQFSSETDGVLTCVERVLAEQKTVPDPSCTVLQLAVRALVAQFQHISMDDGHWSRFQGRIKVKFSVARLNDITADGMDNLNYLFLSLVVARPVFLTDIVGIALRIFRVAAARKQRDLDIPIWRGYLIFILLHVSHAVPLTCDLCQPIVDAFTKASRQFIQTRAQAASSDVDWYLVRLYVSALEEIFTSSPSLELGEWRLVGPFEAVLIDLDRHRVEALLPSVQALLSRVRTLYHQRVTPECGQQFRSLVDVLWLSVYPFVTKAAVRSNPPEGLPDIAVLLTNLSLDLPPSVSTGLSSVNSRSLFTFFSGTPAGPPPASKEFLSRPSPPAKLVHPTVAASYLCHFLRDLNFLSNQNSVDRLGLVVACLRCVALLPYPHVDVQRLSGLVVERRLVGGFSNDTAPQSTQSDYRQFVLDFLTRLLDDDESSRAISLVGVVCDEAVSTVLDAQSNIATVQAGYWFCSALLQVLHPVWSKVGFLRDLVRRLILEPLSPRKDGPQMDLIRTALRPHLAEVIHSLWRLPSYARESQLKDLFVHLLTRYQSSIPSPWEQLSRWAHHPLFTVLTAASVNAELVGYAIDVFTRLFCGVSENSGCALRPVKQALSLLISVCGESTVVCCHGGLMCALLTLQLDEEVVQRRDREIPTLVKTLLRQMILKLSASDVDQKVLTSISGDLCVWIQSSFDSSHQRTVALIGAIASQNSHLVQPCLAVVCQLTKNWERKRGSGIDRQLRLAYNRLVKVCGSDGEMELDHC